MTSWPPSEGLSTPTVSRASATLTTSGSAFISAPAQLVFSLVIDTSTYPSWSSFIPRATIRSQPSSRETPSSTTGRSSPKDPNPATLQPGTTFTYHVRMSPSSPKKLTDTPLRVTDVSTPERQSEYIPEEVRREDESYTEDLGAVYRVSWKGDGGFFARGLQTERFTEVIVRSEGECEVRTWEVMGGVLARTVKWMYKDTLSKRFEEWCADLKSEGEKRARDGRGEVEE